MDKRVNKREYSDLEMWQNGAVKTVSFIVTEACQLRCKYCYFVEKKEQHVMDFEIAKKTIDYLLANKDIFTEETVIWEFIGGEPLLQIDLIDRICEYAKLRMYEDDHHWFNSYRLSFTTNGLLYDDDRVQKFIEKNRTHIEIGITIDGTKEKHDQQRIFPNGKGSYDLVVKNIPLWLKQFPNASTKATFASDDLPMIKESMLHLWSLGIKNIMANLVFEDVWKEGDDKIFEEQLFALADYILENDMQDEYFCSFFAKTAGLPMDPITDNQNWCGSGIMLSVDKDGNFYPCTRFVNHSLKNKNARIIGNIHTGIDQNKLRPFLTLDRCTQSSQDCIDCNVASGCYWCVAENYDAADTETIYQRGLFNCKMHKARVKANKYFFEKLDKKNKNWKVAQYKGAEIC